jgi:diguanylate cyclase (GGDEF)-like protein
MLRRALSLLGRFRGVDAGTDAALYALSVYAVPIAIALVTLVAFVAWDRQFAPGAGTPLDIRVAEQTDQEWSPAQAFNQLKGRPAVRYQDSRLSESPFWFGFEVQPDTETDRSIVVELASRHATETACWERTNFRSLGSANRTESAGRLAAVKAGFSIDLGRLQSPAGILCRARFSGPARINVVQWSEPALQASVHAFHRNSGLLEGGLVVLSAFALLTAVITREWMYALFSAWLIASLRLGALSAGWDTQWFERAIPPDWVVPARKLTIAVYYLLTYMLFSRLFRDDLARVDRWRVLRVVQWCSVTLLAASVILPYSEFLPLMWSLAVVAIVIIVSLLGRILWVTRSRVAMWYSASFGIVLSAAFYEVIAAAFNFKELIWAVNSVTASLPSSLMVALAIAEQMRQERQERVRAQAELRHTYNAIPIGLFTLDPEGRFLQVNPALTQMLGVDPALRKEDYWGAHFEAGAWDRLRDVAQTGAAQEIELRSATGPNEEPRWFFVKATLTNGKIEGSLQDVTDRYNATERLRYLAENDPLTGVLNRRGIEALLDEATQPAGGRRSLAVAYLDLDRFKLINDLFGHIAGDEVLRQVCGRTRRMLAHRHQIGRIGGDEFVIAFQDTPIRLAAAICRGIVDLIGRSPYQIGDKAFQVKGSIGLIDVAPGTSVKDAIAMADRACREAKTGHREGLVVYERDARAFGDRQRELHLIEHLGAGVAPEGLFLVMQPIMSLHAPYESLNFEVLLRMREADGRITSAGEIISAAENNGAVAVIDRWVLANTLAWLDQHHERLEKTRFVCVNLSGGSLNDEKFVQDAFSMLAQHGRAVERLCIEITESVALHDLENTKRFIHRVRDFGAKLALDDFGAGYTSFSYLKELPADAVKIDGSFITGVNSHPANLAIVQAIVELAANLGMRSIAEWVEDRATIEALAQIGVDYVQGHAISMPQEADQILRAESSASFIENEQVTQFVRDSLGRRGTPDLWGQLAKRTRMNLH